MAWQTWNQVTDEASVVVVVAEVEEGVAVVAVDADVSPQEELEASSRMPRVALPPGKTDADYVLGLLRATGILCVYGSGFGTRPEDGFFRIVFLASPEELSGIYDDIAEFTGTFLN